MSPCFRSDASYLITGGLGGFGLATARWLVEQGARHLVLVGRRGAATPEAERAVSELEQAGAQVMIGKADVADAEQLNRVLAEMRRAMPPLRGVFHAPMVLEEGLLLWLNREHFQAVMAPKVAGALNLHRLTAGDPLDCFVLYSSTASLFGTLGLGHYAAANQFLDSLAHYRRARGLPALSVNWTAVADVGYVAHRQDVRAYIEQMGLVPLSSRFLLRALGELLHRGAVQTGVVCLDWSQRGPHTLTAISPRFSQMIPRQETGKPRSDAAPGPSRSLSELLRTAEGPARRELLKTRLGEQVGKALGMSPATLDPDLPLTSMGLESLLAIDLGIRVKRELGFEITILKLLGGVTMNNLLDDLEQQLISSGKLPLGSAAAANRLHGAVTHHTPLQ